MPELIDCARWLWRAWETLSAKRVRTEALPQPITMEAILAYAQFEGIDEPSRRDDLLITLTALDAVFMDFAIKAHIKTLKDAKRKRGKGRR